MKNLILIIVFALIAGCAGKERAIKYYIIDVYAISPPESAESPGTTPLPYAVEVIDFSVAGPYNDTRIALRTESNELQYYHYHRWAELPGSGLRFFVWRMFNDARLFDTAQLRLTVAPPDLVVTGAINTLERLDVEGMPGALVNVSLELIDTRKQKILVRHQFQRQAVFPASAPMNYFAGEISRIMHEEVGEFMIKIREHFTAD